MLASSRRYFYKLSLAEYSPAEHPCQGQGRGGEGEYSRFGFAEEFTSQRARTSRKNCMPDNNGAPVSWSLRLSNRARRDASRAGRGLIPPPSKSNILRGSFRRALSGSLAVGASVPKVNCLPAKTNNIRTDEMGFMLSFCANVDLLMSIASIYLRV